jgi:hypothetical protein
MGGRLGSGSSVRMAVTAAQSRRQADQKGAVVSRLRPSRLRAGTALAPMLSHTALQASRVRVAHAARAVQFGREDDHMPTCDEVC